MATIFWESFSVRSKVLFLAGLMVFGSVSAFAQIEQSKRQRQRVEQMIKADEERQAEERLRRGDMEPIPPRPKPARMNIDVQSVIATEDVATFAQAKLKETKKIVDGQPLWLYVKFNGKLGDYVYAVNDRNNRGKFKYMLFVEVGPQNGITSHSQYLMHFTEDELKQTEIKLNLTSGTPGHNRSMPVLLRAAAAAKKGLWNNELRISNTSTFPRTMMDHVAKSPITFAFAQDPAKYGQLNAAYDSMVMRGSTDTRVLPLRSQFYNEQFGGELRSRLTSKGIDPQEIYFFSDGWVSFLPSKMTSAIGDKLTGVFTYKKGEQCFYGITDISRVYDNEKMAFNEAEYKETLDIKTECLVPIGQ